MKLTRIQVQAGPKVLRSPGPYFSRTAFLRANLWAKKLPEIARSSGISGLDLQLRHCTPARLSGTTN